MIQIDHPSRRGLASHLRQHPHPGGMIVSEKHRFVYMKACRTGGTSILRHTLEKLPVDTFHFKDHKSRFLDWLGRITDDELATYRVFAIVRNPWDRAVSIASYFRIPFAEFAEGLSTLTATDPNLRQHSLPLQQYTHLQGQPFVDRIGQFEQLQQDFERICDWVGVPVREKLPRANQSNHLPYPQHYTPRLKELIDEVYLADARAYGYKFGE